MSRARASKTGEPPHGNAPLCQLIHPAEACCGRLSTGRNSVQSEVLWSPAVYKSEVSVVYRRPCAPFFLRLAMNRTKPGLRKSQLVVRCWASPHMLVAQHEEAFLVVQERHTAPGFNSTVLANVAMMRVGEVSRPHFVDLHVGTPQPRTASRQHHQAW